MAPNKCPRGTIRRKSFRRKSGSRVRSTCVPDKGRRGKTPPSGRVLPPFDKKMALRKHGYSTKKSTRQRHESLRKASRQYTPIKVLRHLNLARNYQADTKAKKIMSDDVEYMSKFYSRSKTRSRSRSRSRSFSRSRSRSYSRSQSRSRSRKQSRSRRPRSRQQRAKRR